MIHTVSGTPNEEVQEVIPLRLTQGLTLFKQEFFQKIILAGRSQETYKNYLRAIAQVSLHYQTSPLLLSDQQINQYLVYYKVGNLDRKPPSEAYFKHVVFGVRYIFSSFEIPNRKICMPSIKRKQIIPDILNREEVIELISSPKNLKHLLLFALTYGSGFRINEVRHVKIADIDIFRKVVHVRLEKK